MVQIYVFTEIEEPAIETVHMIEDVVRSQVVELVSRRRFLELRFVATQSNSFPFVWQLQLALPRALHLPSSLISLLDNR